MIEGMIVGAAAVVYNLMGDHAQAVEHFTQALAITREIGDRQSEGAHSGNLGTAYESLGQYAKAQLELLVQTKDVDDAVSQSGCLIGCVHEWKYA